MDINVKVIKDIEKIIDGEVLLNELMKNHTSFNIGGPAKVLVEPRNEENTVKLINYLIENNIRYHVIGNGSNLLVCDRGLDAVVIKIANKFSDYEVKGNIIKAYSGILLSKLSNIAYEKGLTGMEGLSGIPGSLGGAVYMNAGAYGFEIKNVVNKTTYVDNCGIVKTICGDEHEFGYRRSFFSEKKYIILSCELILDYGNKNEILEKMKDFTTRRNEKQPMTQKSAGSTFKRPKDNYAGYLIQSSNLKGFKIGGAMVSEKHAGFVVNDGSATCSDILQLVEYVKMKVYEDHGVELEMEIRYLSDETEVC